MIASQAVSKIKRGLKFTDNVDDNPSPKSPKREKPGHKSFTFAQS